MQALVRAAIRDQIEATRVGIEYLQVGANKTALEELCQQKDAKYTKAVAEWQDGIRYTIPSIHCAY